MYTKTLEVSADSGEWLCVEMPAPARGVLERVIVKQIDGTLAGFTFDILDRRDACEGEPVSSMGLDDIETRDKALHRVAGQVVVAASSSTSERYNLSAEYCNQDEQDVTRRPTTRLYLDLKPDGTGAKTFQIAYTCVPVGQAQL